MSAADMSHQHTDPEPIFFALSLPLSADLSELVKSRRWSAILTATGDSSSERYVRGIANTMLGKDVEARSDFEAASKELRAPSALEIANLDLRSRRIDVAHESLRGLEGDNDLSPTLHARRLHLLGMVHGNRRRSGDAHACLHGAIAAFRDAGLVASVAQVLDTTGMVHAAEGRLDLALVAYARAVVEKSLLKDEFGMAVSLGNFGRVYLDLGRYDDARDCFFADLEISRRLGDRRGVVKMLGDLGRTEYRRGFLDEARKHLEEACAIAETPSHTDIRFFAKLDLVRVEDSAGRAIEAEARLKSAEVDLDQLNGDYYRAHFAARRGESLVRRRRAEEAVHSLKEAAAAFRRLELPEDEFATRLLLADTRVDLDAPSAAIAELEICLSMARSDGFARHLPLVRSKLARLGVRDHREHDDATRPVIPGYTVTTLLGGGGFGTVWLGVDQRTDRLVAIKVFSLSRIYAVQHRRLNRASAVREAEALGRIRHPGIAQCIHFDFTRTDDPYIVQDFIRGSTLRDVIRSGIRPGVRRLAGQTTIVSGIAKLAHALEELHAAGVVHRDIKPSNVVMRASMSEEGPAEDPVIIDLGIASIADAPPITDEGVTLGTIAFGAPEQFDPKAFVDGRADVFALGGLAFEWITGISASVRAEGWSRETTVKRLKDFRPDVDDAIADLVARMSTIDVASRPTAKEVARDCERILEWRRSRGASDRPVEIVSSAFAGGVSDEKTFIVSFDESNE